MEPGAEKEQQTPITFKEVKAGVEGYLQHPMSKIAPYEAIGKYFNDKKLEDWTVIQSQVVPLLSSAKEQTDDERSASNDSGEKSLAGMIGITDRYRLQLSLLQILLKSGIKTVEDADLETREKRAEDLDALIQTFDPLNYDIKGNSGEIQRRLIRQEPERIPDEDLL